VRIHSRHRCPKDYTSKVTEIITAEIVTKVLEGIGDEQTSQQASTSYTETA